jgi:glycogen synthase
VTTAADARDKGTRPLRILMVTPAFPPFVGGGERYAHALATTLATRGHDIVIMTSNARRQADFWQRRDARTTFGENTEDQDVGLRVIRCPVHGFPGGRTALDLWRKIMICFSALPGDQSCLLVAMAQHVPCIAGMAEAIDRLDVDIIHAFNLSWECPLTLAWQAAQRRGLPLVVTPFLHPGGAGDRRVIRNHNMDHQRHILREAMAVLAMTDVEREALVDLGVARERIAVVGGGVEANESIPVAELPPRISDRLPAGIPLVLLIGRVSRDKGALQAVEAVVGLQERGVAVALVLVGEPSREFERLYGRLTPEERQIIIPLGIVDEDTKHALLRQATMLVLPSAVESLGIVVLEAWVHGKPVIGARAGGLAAVIDEGRNGLLVEYDDIDGLADAIAALLGDPALAERLGSAGQRKARTQFSWDAVTDRVEAAYAAALGEG